LNVFPDDANLKKAFFKPQDFIAENLLVM